MSWRAVNWVLAFHVLGFVVWIGAMFAISVMLTVHSRAPQAARATLSEIERALARWMDIGALVAIACGVILLLGKPGPSLLKQPYMHIKLTLVAGLLGLHGLVRVKAARMGRDQGQGLPPAVPLIILVVAGAIAVVIMVRPFASA